MSAVLWFVTILLTIHASRSYILLTANLEDVQAIAKQLAQSPVADQLKNIWRRASGHFNQYMNRVRARANDENSAEGEYRKDGSAEDHRLNRRVQENTVDRAANDEKNASFYLSSIKKIMDAI